jgi:predicted nucleic acid-binding protein
VIGVDTTFLVHLEVREAPEHARAHHLLRTMALDVGEDLALSPQTLAEFLHVVTDPKRFRQPLSMDEALAKARFWWKAKEVRHVFPTADSTLLMLEWIERHHLGRKRLLDTQLAATFWSAGVRRVFTSNGRDFIHLAPFDIISP